MDALAMLEAEHAKMRKLLTELEATTERVVDQLLQWPTLST